MNRMLIVSLRVLLVLLFLALLIAQVLFFPLLASETARENPDLSYLWWPYLVVALLSIACLEVALGAIWVLLTRVSGQRIFEPNALLPVDVMIGAGLVGAALAAGILFHAIFIVGVAHAGFTAIMFSCIVGALAFVLLMVVMRGLLVSATRLRQDMEEVI